MSVTNEGVTLVPMAECHLSNTYRWLHESSELRRQVDCLESPTLLGNQVYWYARWQNDCREDYAIVTTAKHRHIGNCGLSDIDLLRRKAQLWIYLGEEYESGKGTDAVKQLLSRAFGVLELNRVYLRVLADNERALRFYQKLKFVEEGSFRQDTIVDGRVVDAICMSMLRSEFVTNIAPEYSL